MCDINASKFRFDFRNFWEKKTNCLKIVVINYYFLIKIKFQFLKKIYSLNQLFVCVQHLKKVSFQWWKFIRWIYFSQFNRSYHQKIWKYNSQRFFDQDHLQKMHSLFFQKFVSIFCSMTYFYSISNAKIYSILNATISFFNSKATTLFFIRTRNLTVKLLIFWIQITYH